MLRRILQSTVIVACVVGAIVFSTNTELNSALKDTALYEDTVYTISMVEPTLNTLKSNRKLLQQYMYTRYPKVPELDWDKPNELHPGYAIWKFRWLSKDWFLKVKCDPINNRLTEVMSQEEVAYE